MFGYGQVEFPVVDCVCGHPVSAHKDRGKGRCTALVGKPNKVALYDCACEFFVPKPPKDKKPAPAGELTL